VSPGCTGYVVWVRYCAVMPCSSTAAAVSSSTPPGTGTTRAAGTTALVAYAPGRIAQATRSPAAMPTTPSPTAATVPAASVPSWSGSSPG
jgi:hypothetical protein